MWAVFYVHHISKRCLFSKRSSASKDLFCFFKEISSVSLKKSLLFLQKVSCFFKEVSFVSSKKSLVSSKKSIVSSKKSIVSSKKSLLFLQRSLFCFLLCERGIIRLKCAG